MRLYVIFTYIITTVSVRACCVLFTKYTVDRTTYCLNEQTISTTIIQYYYARKIVYIRCDPFYTFFFDCLTTVIYLTKSPVFKKQNLIKMENT